MKLPYILIFVGVLVLAFIVTLSFAVLFRSSGSSAVGAAGGAGIYRSTDAAESWALTTRSSELRSALPANILSFVFDPTNSKIIYLGTKGGGLWVSKTGGTSWARMIDAKGTLKSYADIYGISVSRAKPSTFYLAVYQDNRGRVFKTADGGITFDEVYFVPLDRFGVFAALANPDNPSQVIIGTGEGGFLQTEDGGKSWKIHKWFPDGIVRLIANPSNFNELFALTSKNELYRTEDRGDSWVRLTDGFRSYPGATDITDIWIDPLNSSTLYLASKFGLVRSQDSGNTFQVVPLIIPPEGLPVRSVTTDFQNSRRIYAAAASQVYRSDDFGDHWQILDVPTKSAVRMIRTDPMAPGTIYAIVGN